MSSTRRDFLQQSAIAFAALAGHQAHARPLEPALSEVGYGQVQLAPCAQRTQFEEHQHLLLELSEDDMLKPFRVREGVAAPGKGLPGWYDTYAFAPAHSFGQWVSALARGYAVTGDKRAQAKAKRLLRGYIATASASGKFYQENRFPSYTYDKLVCGMVDAYRYAKDEQAIAMLRVATNAVSSFLPQHAVPRRETEVLHREDLTEHCWDESYTLPENQFLAWKLTSDEQYLAQGKRLIYDEFFRALARDENALPGKHAYSHVNALSSAAQAYLTLGDPVYLDAAKKGFAMVEQQSYITGGWGPDEHFFVPGSAKLADSLQSVHPSFETPCGSYAHFKITRYLLRITKDPHYGDSMERVMYNTILGARPVQPDGTAFYYSDYTFGAHKFAHPDKWPCCTGTLPQISSDYGISSYLRDPKGVYVNLFIPSTYKWNHSGAECSLTQTTDYPYKPDIRLDVTSSAPRAFSVYLRVPAWAKGSTLTLSGESKSRELEPGTWAEVRREWKSGDRIELELPGPLRVEPIDAQHTEIAGLLAGPLVLMALGKTTPRVSRKQLLSARQKSGGSHGWITEGSVGAQEWKPFPDISTESYSTYVHLQSD